MRAAFFDLDKTVIATSSALAFSRPFYQGGLINRRAVLRSAYAQFVYLAGGADADQIERMRRYLSSLCAGWDVNQVREIIPMNRLYPATLGTAASSVTNALIAIGFVNQPFTFSSCRNV